MATGKKKSPLFFPLRSVSTFVVGAGTYSVRTTNLEAKKGGGGRGLPFVPGTEEEEEEEEGPAASGEGFANAFAIVTAKRRMFEKRSRNRETKPRF